MGRRNERSEKPGTSKEHPRNMLATCLELLHDSGDAAALLQPAGEAAALRSTLTRMRAAHTIRADLNHAIPIDLRDASKLHFLPAHVC